MAESYETMTLFGATPNGAYMDAQSMNAYAADPQDFNTILTQGIMGAAAAGINGLIGKAYASGQLKPLPLPPAQQQEQNRMTLIVIGVIAYLLLKG